VSTIFEERFWGSFPYAFLYAGILRLSEDPPEEKKKKKQTNQTGGRKTPQAYLLCLVQQYHLSPALSRAHQLFLQNRETSLSSGFTGLVPEKNPETLWLPENQKCPFLGRLDEDQDPARLERVRGKT
jgi:hypothetical protein